MPAIDPQVQALLDLIKSLNRPPFEKMSPEQARAAYAAGRDFMQLPPEDVAAVRDLSIAGPGGPLTLRVYRGTGTKPDEALPCMVFLHGGGWVIGDLESHDLLCRRIANLARICVVAVEYRLAPEHPYPAALDDCVAALQWVAASAKTLVIDPKRLAIGGDSAGGNLAAVLALMGRDGTVPPTMYQALLYPVTDLACDTGSYQRVTSGVPLTATTMHWFIDLYAPAGVDRLDWRLSPLRAASLAGTPPALVVTAGHDPLCDEGRAYAERLDREGVRMTALHLNDQLHGAATQNRQVRASTVLVNQIGAAIGEALHHGPALP
jgi:acetyl esterase